MPYEKICCSNGVQLHTVTTEGLVVEHLNVYFMLPIGDKSHALTVLPRILLRGCKKYPTNHDINKRLAYLFASSVWGDVAYCGENIAVTFSASFLKNSAAYDGCDIMGNVLDLLFDVIFDPLVKDGAFDEKYVSGEIANKCDSMRAAINNKDNYASLRCAQIMSQGQKIEFCYSTDTKPYEALSASDIFEGYKNMLSRAPVYIVYAGDSKDIAEKFACRVSDALGAREVTQCSNLTPYVTPNGVRTLEEKHDVKQAHLVLGFRDNVHASDKQLCATAVFEELFGQSPVSRLFCNVREKHSLCYYCSSSHDEANGIMYISTGIKAENKDKAYNEIIHQLDCVRRGEITPQEIEIAKKSIKSGWLARNDSAGALAARCMYRVFFYGEYISVEDEISQLWDVTSEDVRRVANGLQADTVYFMYGDEVKEGEDGEF